MPGSPPSLAPPDVTDVDIHVLRAGWPRREFDSRSLGDAWLAKGTALLLRVPSVIVPGSWNSLVNPSHPGMRRVRILSATPDPFDRRLFGGRRRPRRRDQ